jgi:aspartate kinase
MTVWKDVPGVLNADPKHFENTYLLSHISYREAIELTYYGASVIHPKTIKPLQNKGITLRVKSFLSPEACGTSIGPTSKDDDKSASIILKSDQTLLSFLVKDFSFIAENNLSEIFAALAKSAIRVNMMQQSAISFSICFDENTRKMDVLLELLGEKFEYRYNTGLQLITVRHYDQLTINKLLTGRQLLLEQRSRTTAQFVVKVK